MSQAFKAVIFDLDDTLFDCTGLLMQAALRRAAAELIRAGLPMSVADAVVLQQDLAERHGPHFMVFDEIARRHNLDEGALDAAYRAYSSDDVTDIDPFPDVIPTLRALRAKGVLCILLTNGLYPRQQAKIHNLGLQNEFDDILINDLDRGGLLGECVRYLLDRYSLDPKNVLIVGDRPGEEIRVGNQLGLVTVRTVSGRFREAEPRDQFEVPDYRITHIFQVLTIVRLAEVGKTAENLRIVALGGGTGLPIVLEGCKAYSRSLTAIVTVTDNGRSSGKLRAELGMLAPGDVRNCLVALSEPGKKQSRLNELFQYRFSNGSLNGTSLGNLIIAAMYDMTGSFEEGVRAVSGLLNIQGKVLPSTVTNCQVCAELEDGSTVEGEVSVRETGKPGIRRVFLSAEAPEALEEAVAEIKAADIIVMGPGSLFTSVIPNLLVPDVRRAIIDSSAAKYYVCNMVTQPGQTDGFSASRHYTAVSQHLGNDVVDCMLLNCRQPDSDILQHYADEGAELVTCDPRLEDLRVAVSQADLMEDIDGPRILWEKQDMLRHDPVKLGDAICRVFGGLEAFNP